MNHYVYISVIMVRAVFLDFCKKYPNVVIENSIDVYWYKLLNEVFAEAEKLGKLAKLNDFLKNCSDPINPAREHIWAFTKSCVPNKVKVVIVGQDPYPGEYLRNVTGFSVHRSTRYIPPSLKVILQEVQDDILNSRYAPTLRGYPPRQGCLEYWERQGVLLLDAVLTVSQKKPGSHAGEGWEEIVGSILTKLQTYRLNQNGAMVFMLWGTSAQMMEHYLNVPVNKLVLKAPHPVTDEPFRGCKHFSKTNDFLVAAGEEPINWSLC